MTKHLYFRIADHPFSLVAPAYFDAADILPSFQPFVQETAPVEPLFCLTLVEQVDAIADGNTMTHFEWEGAECVINENQDAFEVNIFPKGAGKGWRMQTDKLFGNARAEMHDNDPRNGFVLQNFLMMLFTFATSPKGTLMFHASVIRCNGEGYLFLGKSGTGKSTHTRLWLQHIEGAELLNDDNPIVRWYPDGRAVVYGSPWSGKTPCYRNEEAPVRAFVRLQQAPYNRITQQGTARAFAALLPSCSCLKQDSNQYEYTCQTVTALAANIPVYHLECLPNREAAETCYSTIKNQSTTP